VRPEPSLDDVHRFFFEGGSTGSLSILRCQSCAFWIHPPSPACPACWSDDVAPELVSGRGTLYSFIVARQAFATAFVEELPYVVALTELVEQPGLRVLTNVAGVDPDQAEDVLRVGMPMEVTFEQRGAWFVPQFRPVTAEVPA